LSCRDLKRNIKESEPATTFKCNFSRYRGGRLLLFKRRLSGEGVIDRGVKGRCVQS